MRVEVALPRNSILNYNKIVVPPAESLNYKSRILLHHDAEREAARRWFKDFIMHYIPEHFDSSFGEHQEDLLGLIQNGTLNKRVVRCMPRESGKSTILLYAAPLWWLARRDKWYIALFGSGGGAFWNHYSSLQNTLDRDIGNQKLLDDYPHLAPLKDFKGQFVSWNDARLKVTSGAIVEPRTMGSHVRGMKEGKHRPDAMVFDDPQDEDTVSTDYQRAKFASRFRTTLVNLISNPGDIFIIGNFLHPDSLVGQLLREPKWDGKLYRAENVSLDERDRVWPIGNTKRDGSALWPERWTIERLHQRRDEIGTRAYTLEFMNKMLSDEEIIYDSTRLMKYDAADFDLDSSFDVAAFWDPSDPKEHRVQEADYACIAVVAAKRLQTEESSHTFFWILDVWMQQARVELQVEAALRLLKK